MFVLMPIIILLILWIKYESAKTERANHNSSSDFWKREQDASHARNQDISSLPIFTFKEEDLPKEATKDYELAELFGVLSKLSGKDIVNLSEYTNTDLKLTFGIGRFAYLAECDANFALLMKTLDQLGKYYICHQEPQKARIYLDYAVSHQTDLRHTYEQLVTISDETSSEASCRVLE